MSKTFYNAQNLTIGNGFVRNPDRYYLEEYFEMLPSISELNSSIVDISEDADSKAFTIVQPANTFLLEVGLICVEAFVTGAGNTAFKVGTQAGGTEICAGANAVSASAKAISVGAKATTLDSTVMSDGATTLSFVTNGAPNNGSSRTIHGTFDPAAAVTFAGTAKMFIKVLEINRNKNFMISGTDVANSTISFDSTRAGINLQTHSNTGDQVVISPVETDNQSPWNSIKWGTENQLEWECALSIPTTSALVWAGLKLNKTRTLDANQVYFITEVSTDIIYWNVVVSINSTNYKSQIPGAVVANKIYKLRISIDSSRFARIYINDIQYNITTVSGTKTAVTAGAIPSKQLKDDIDFVPVIGVEAETNSARNLNVYYEKISRVLHE